MRGAAAAVLIAACVHVPTKDYEAPRQFLLRLLEIARAGDAAAWRGMLSKRMRERQPDDESAFGPMHVWAQDLAQHEGEIRTQHCVLGDGSLECGHFIVKVSVEDGQLRLDEN